MSEAPRIGMRAKVSSRFSQSTGPHSSPSPGRFPPIGAGRANYFGLHDLHELVWEWVADFNTAMVTGDAHGDSGSQDAKDPTPYPAFLRFGFCSSLKADYTVHNLGFRCAKDL